MKPLLLLVDLQKDFLGAAGLEPAAAEVVAKAARLLAGARASGVPVVHAMTSVDAAADDRMPHWKAADRWKCVPGTPGHAAPPELAPEAGEPVVAKRFFSAFDAPELGPVLAGSGADTLIVAGVHLHGCVRATVLDAYARGFAVVVAEDAVGSDDPLHAAVTRRYLDGRAARFATVEELLAAIGGGSEVSGPWRACRRLRVWWLPRALPAGTGAPCPGRSARPRCGAWPTCSVPRPNGWPGRSRPTSASP